MSHVPFCPSAADENEPCLCLLIGKVRSYERVRIRNLVSAAAEDSGWIRVLDVRELCEP